MEEGEGRAEERRWLVDKRRRSITRRLLELLPLLLWPHRVVEFISHWHRFFFLKLLSQFCSTNTITMRFFFYLNLLLCVSPQGPISNSSEMVHSFHLLTRFFSQIMCMTTYISGNTPSVMSQRVCDNTMFFFCFLFFSGL